MKKIKIVSLLTLGLALIIVVVQNTDPVRSHFLWMTAEIPAIVLLMMVAVGGFVSGLLVALLIKTGSDSRK